MTGRRYEEAFEIVNTRLITSDNYFTRRQSLKVGAPAASAGAAAVGLL